MSVAFETNTVSDSNRIGQPGFAQGMWIYNSSETGRFTGDDRRSSKFPVDKDDDDQDSSSSSSIGNNSDASGGGGDSDDDGGEVQSLFKGSLNNLCALEQALPIKRGISTFYAGKSKSYTSLADAVSAPSIQDIVKPEDAYNRKRKNMIAHSVFINKNRNLASKSGLTKRFANANRGSLPLDSNNNHNNNNTSGETSSLSSSPNLSLPPLPSRAPRLPTNELSDSSPRVYSSPWRSYSLSDLQHAAVETSRMKNSLGNKIDEKEDD